MTASDAAFPEAFRAIAARLGIDVSKPAELCHCGREPSGLHVAGGWFHLVGRILAGSDAWVNAGGDAWTLAPEELVKGFEFGFTARLALVPEPFRGRSVVQLEFSTRVPWVIADVETS